MNNCFVETGRLLLRRLEEADFPAYAAYAVDDEMSRMMGRAFLHAETDIRQNFDWLKDKEPRCYGIVEKANEQLIGNLNIGALPAPLAALPQLQGNAGRRFPSASGGSPSAKGMPPKPSAPSLPSFLTMSTSISSSAGVIRSTRPPGCCRNGWAFNFWPTSAFPLRRAKHRPSNTFYGTQGGLPCLT